MMPYILLHAVVRNHHYIGFYWSVLIPTQDRCVSICFYGITRHYNVWLLKAVSWGVTTMCFSRLPQGLSASAKVKVEPLLNAILSESDGKKPSGEQLIDINESIIKNYMSECEANLLTL